MDGLLLVHAKSGHVLLSKAYTEGFGIKIEDQGQTKAKEIEINTGGQMEQGRGQRVRRSTADHCPLCSLAFGDRFRFGREKGSDGRIDATREFHMRILHECDQLGG